MQKLNQAFPRSISRSVGAALALCAGGFSAAHAQTWTVISLHPAGAVNSEARAVYGGQQGGVVNPATANGGAVVWSGSAPSVTSLNPVVPGQASTGVSSDLGAYGLSGCVFNGRQGGSVSLLEPSQGVGSFTHASIWSGSPGSWVDLHPSDPAVIHSFIYALDQDTQAGGFDMNCGGTFCAGTPCLWHGTPDSFVDLTPSGFGSGQVNGLFGNEQVGATFDTGLGWACLWHGTADSFVNLNPDPNLFSAATCTDGTHQYGTGAILFDTYGGLYPVQWSGTAGSMLSMGVPDPTAQWGEIDGCSGNVQVGYITDNNLALDFAYMWSTVPGSFVDISQFLPAGYNNSHATGVWQDPVSGTVYIVGYATNTTTSNREAFMWVYGSGVNLITSPTAPPDCSVAVGGAMNYSVRVLNAGSDLSGPITLTVDLPPSTVATFAGATPPPTTITPTRLTFSLAPLAGSGASTDVAITLTATGPGATATITATATTAGEQDPTNNVASASSRAQPGVPSSAPARAIFSTITSQPNSLVPGGGGARFTQLNRPISSPSGNWWVETASTDAANTQNLVMTRSATGGAPAVVAQTGVTATSNGTLSSIDVGAEVNDNGVVALAGGDDGAAHSNRFIGTTSGAGIADAARMDQPIPALPGIVYGSDVGASANLFASGQVGFSTISDPAGSDAYLANNGTTVIAEVGVTTLAAPDGNTYPIQALVTASTDGQTHGGICFDPSGAHFIYQCDLNTGSTTNNTALVADGVVIAQQGVTMLPGTTSPVDGINKDLFMGPGGEWLIHGRDTTVSENWVIRGSGSTIAQVYVTGDPIYAGASEHWAPDTTITGGGLTFFAQLADASGNYIIGGTTDNPDHFANNVLVYNNQTVIARENDPVDLDGNGLFDDGVYIAGFNTLTFDALQDGVAFVNGGVLALVTLRDATAALCHSEDNNLGQALVFIPISACGSADFNCDGDIGTDADIEAFFACLAGNCPPPPCNSSADFNGDGDVGTDADIEAFFRVLAGGNC